MEIKEFAVKLQSALMKKLGEDYDVQIARVPKNNGVWLHGLTIQREDRNVAPTIYMNGFLDAYNDGVPLSYLVERILDILQKDSPTGDVDMSFFHEFDKVKDRICYRIINAEKNRELLQMIPHRLYLDLAVCFFYSYQGDELGHGSILIYNSHMELWQTSLEELWELAKVNTPMLFPWESNSMESVVKELLEKKQEEDEFLWEHLVPMYVLSNRERLYGASCVLYPQVLEQLAEELQADLFILPSSIHEIILLPDNHQDSPEQLQHMIQEINETQVEPEDVLSDNLYYYDRNARKMRLFL